MILQKLSNFDSSYFNVKVGKLPPNTKGSEYLTDKIISFEIVEELGKMMHGTLMMEEDFYFKTSSIMSKFTPIELWWGYKSKEQIQKDAYVKTKNSMELFTPAQATRYAKGFIHNPSWNCGSDGKQMYSCQFMCYDNPWMQAGNKLYNGGTKGTVIIQALVEMGIVNSAFVKFRRSNDVVMGDTAIRRDNCSLFKFLNQLALEWQCIFRIVYDKNQQPQALFCNFDDDKTIQLFTNLVGGCVGSSVLWEYKGGKKNVMSYTAQYNSAEGGAGDNVQMVMMNGQPTFFRTIANTNTVQYFKLNTEKMAAEMRNSGNVGAQSQLLGKWLQANKWEDIKRYFDVTTTTTAPQGIGLSINLEAIGNPLCTAPSRAVFGDGFPDIFKIKGAAQTSAVSFYQTGVTHKIDKSGYKMSVSIADAFTVTGGTLVA